MLDKFGAAMAAVKSDVGGNLSVRRHVNYFGSNYFHVL